MHDRSGLTMRVLIAPDSFKGTMSATDVAHALADGVLRACADADIDLCPVSDGGSGFARCLLEATGGQWHECPTTDPIGREIYAHIALLGDGVTAAVDFAAASGLSLLTPEEYDPLGASSWGTGELLNCAMYSHVDMTLIGLGDSATCDAGLGMLAALGMGLFDRTGAMLGGRLGARDLDRVAALITPDQPSDSLQIACDVTAPLLGEHGAARAFGPQKGASPEVVERLERLHAHFAQVTGGDAQRPGTGAAGGAGFGLHVATGAPLRSGRDIVFEAVSLDERIDQAQLVLTGEGRLDASSSMGKCAVGVAQRARAQSRPTACIVGCVAEGWRSATADHGGPLDVVEIATGAPAQPADLSRAACTAVRDLMEAPI